MASSPPNALDEVVGHVDLLQHRQQCVIADVLRRRILNLVAQAGVHRQVSQLRQHQPFADAGQTNLALTAVPQGQTDDGAQE